MPKIAEIVHIINTNLQTSQFSGAKFQKGRFSGIAELMPYNEDGEIIPVIIDNNGDSTYLGIDDICPLEVYHRTIGVAVPETEDDFGDLITTREEFNMKLVCIADRSMLQVTKEQIISAIMLGVPSELTKSQLNSLSIAACEITPNSFEVDMISVSASEYSFGSNKLKPNTIMVSLDYSIITEVIGADCVGICN